MQNNNRYKIHIEYDGTGFAGWQTQKNSISVQEVLENAIFKFSNEKTILYAAGRTDAGVHAIGQVAHFDLEKNFSEDEILGAINFHARPHAVCVKSCKMVGEEFHARFSALERGYYYRIINRKAPFVIDKNRAWHVPHQLDVDKMIEASKFLLGTHDFTSFRASQCQAKSPIKTVNQIIIQKISEEEIRIDITAKSFLHHMVRNIVGTLVDVGKGKLKPENLKNILDAKDRKKAGQTAPAFGLYFSYVRY